MNSNRFSSKLASFSTRPKSQSFWPSGKQSLLVLIKNSIPLSAWMCLGAVIQSAFILLPVSSITRHWRVYVTLFPVFFIFAKIINTLLITYGFKKNPFLPAEAFLNDRVTALVPDKDGNLPELDEAPNKNKVAVLILGATVNHPAGYLAPHTSKFGELSGRMFKELETLPQEETGFLGSSMMYQYGPKGNLDTYIIGYWRSIEAIHNYAVSPAHTDTINWWNKESKNGGLAHIGIMHEIFEAGEGAWESVYLNFQPTNLGATSYLKKPNEKGVVAGRIGDEWISPIVDARGKLRNSRGRLGWDAYKERV